jgi:hypothetical protein
MFTGHRNANRDCSLGLALCCVLVVPALAPAASVTVKNELTVPVLVQAVGLVRGLVVRDKPYLLKPNESKAITSLPGNKTVYIYETTAGRLVGSTVVSDSTDDLYFAVVLGALRGTAKLDPRKPPTTMMKP